MNRLTRGMDLVGQYNAMYPPRAAGGAGVPQEQFQPSPQGQTGPALSPQEAAAREARWMAETGQAIDERGNVVQVAPPQGPQFSMNPGVIRRAPEPMYGPPPQQQYGPGIYYPYPQPPDRAIPRPQAQQQVGMQAFAPVQSIQSIDLERGIVWAGGQSFPFDLRNAQQVVYFALEVISGAFAQQLGNLLQQYGLAVVPAQEVRNMQETPTKDPVLPVQQHQERTPDSVQGVQPELPAEVSSGGTVQEQVPGEGKTD